MIICTPSRAFISRECASLSERCRLCGDQSYQLQPAIWVDDCLPSGNVTISGWTLEALGDFLGVLDSAHVQVLTIWTGGAFIDPATTVTCPCFVPALRRWALGGNAPRDG